MNIATRIARIEPLNAAEVEACAQWEAEQAWADFSNGRPSDTPRARDFMRAYLATHAGFEAGRSTSPALTRENDRRHVEQYGRP